MCLKKKSSYLNKNHSDSESGGFRGCFEQLKNAVWLENLWSWFKVCGRNPKI